MHIPNDLREADFVSAESTGVADADRVSMHSKGVRCGLKRAVMAWCGGAHLWLSSSNDTTRCTHTSRKKGARLVVHGDLGQGRTPPLLGSRDGAPGRPSVKILRISIIKSRHSSFQDIDSRPV